MKNVLNAIKQSCKKIKNFFNNFLIRLGLIIGFFGCGPLLIFSLLDAMGVLADKNANPIGLGLLFYVTALPAISCVLLGFVYALVKHK